MEEEEKRLDDIKKKIQILFDQKLPVHIMQHNRMFLNGYICESPSAEFFFMDEAKFGKRWLVFFTDIFSVEQQDVNYGHES